MSVWKSDETLLSICILNFSLKNDFVWEEISNIRHSVSSPYETPRSSSKILRCASYFQLSSRCFIWWWNTASHVWYITSALLFSTRKPTPTPPFIISPHTLVTAKQVSLAVDSSDFAVFVLKTQISRKRVVIWCPFLNNVDTPRHCCRTIFMPSDELTGLMPWTITAPLIKGRIGTWVNFYW